MRREFSINIFILITLNLLIKPLYIFGIDRSVQNIVGTTEYGIYFELLSFVYLFQIINDPGLQNFNSREISRHPHLVNKYFPGMLIIKSLLGIIFLICIFIGGMLLGYEWAKLPLLFIIAATQIASSMVLYLRSNIAGLGKYRIDSFLSISDKLLMIAICSVLILIESFRMSFRIEWFVYAQLVSFVMTGLFAMLILRKNISFRISKTYWPLLKIIFKKSYPFALVTLLTVLYTRIDAVMIGRMLADGEYEAGVYGASYRLLDASNMIGFLFATLLLPMFSKMLKDKAAPDRLVNHSFQLIWAGSVTLGVSAFFFRKEIMFLLYHEATPYFGDVMGWLILSFIPIAGTYIYGTLLLATGNLKRLNLIYSISIVLNICLNLLFIPSRKAEGAAIATFITQSFVFISEIILAKKEAGLQTKAILYLRIILFLFTSIGIAFILSNFGFLQWGFNFCLCILLCSLLALIGKLVNFTNLAEIITRK